MPFTELPRNKMKTIAERFKYRKLGQRDRGLSRLGPVLFDLLNHRTEYLLRLGETLAVGRLKIAFQRFTCAEAKVVLQRSKVFDMPGISTKDVLDSHLSIPMPAREFRRTTTNAQERIN